MRWLVSPHGSPGPAPAFADGDGTVVRTVTAADLLFTSDAILRGIVEVYSSDDATEQFVHDFVDAWDKVVMLDRFDVR